MREFLRRKQIAFNYSIRCNLLSEYIWYELVKLGTERARLAHCRRQKGNGKLDWGMTQTARVARCESDIQTRWIYVRQSDWV